MNLKTIVKKLISIPSISGHEEEIANYIENLCDEAGCNVIRDKDHNVFAFTHNNKVDLTLNGHMDTVPPGNWRFDPFKPIEKEGKIYGLGSTDMKAGLAIMLSQLFTYKGDVPLCCAFTVNEEGGGHQEDGVIPFLKKFTPKQVIILEPSCFGEEVSIVIGCQGRIISQFTIEGKTAHSASFEKGENAIYNAYELINEISSHAQNLKPELLRDDVYAIPALSVTSISGGVAENVIPDKCNVTVDYRFPPTKTVDQAEEFINSFGKNTVSAYRSGFLTPFDSLLLNCAKEEIIKQCGSLRQACLRGWIDAALFTEKNVDAINIGPGLFGYGHSAGEYCLQSNIVKCNSIIKGVLERINS